MTALAQSSITGFMTGLGQSSAGEHGKRITQITFDALGFVKAGSTAGSTLVFNDLVALADEARIDPNASPTFNVARRFLLALPSHLLVAGLAPELALDNDGDIVFDWVGTGDRMLTVTLSETGKLHYAARLSAWDKEHGTKRFVDSIPRPILELIQKVTTTV
ncbi:hypothetical protein [Mitsuaria sp. 7]|uniref:hypothetical protein n=1 Tax=Mitsuaria sp. 7 TaxID=1658665 RepID=UPI0007DD9640|nr:hypothetical protein [Mitsuaria sp. 7]ANH69634.1 hypothetical protein ABE85_22320 [Mitsuaria sp. 7]